MKANSTTHPEQQTLVEELQKTAEQPTAEAVADGTAAGAPKAIGEAHGGNR